MYVRYEDGKWINGIGVYFFILDNINKKIFDLIIGKFSKVEEAELVFFDLAISINILIPMKSKKLSEEDGIMRLSKYFEFLNLEYNQLYNEFHDELITLNNIRNKFEHVPHLIKWTNYLYGENFKKIIFINQGYNYDIIEGNKEQIIKREKNNESLKWQIDTASLIRIVVDLDDIFIKIQDKLIKYFDDNIEGKKHPYIHRITSIDLKKHIKKLQAFML